MTDSITVLVTSAAGETAGALALPGEADIARDIGKGIDPDAIFAAREALARRMAERGTQRQLLDGVARVFGLDAPPERIEVYDNSHIQGTNAVGAMIVAGPEGFVKNQYRKFNIRSTDITPGDDFGMMREVLTRRFARLLKEAPRGPKGDETERDAALPEPARPDVAEGDDGITPAFSEQAAERSGGKARRARSTSADLPPSALEQDEDESLDEAPEIIAEAAEDASPWPDLVLIDGGLGQLNAARAVLEELGITDVPLVGIAKGLDREAGREQFFLPGRTAFRMEPRDPVLYYIQRLRDEAHRFAIGSHRARRKKDITEAGLQAIPGVGPTRKRALLRHFGTLKAIERASLADLETVSGINAATAKAIYDYFHERPLV